MTATPAFVQGRGIYWTKLIALNFDPVSSLRGKQPSVYDGWWTGINVLQLVTGIFGGVQRAFAFTYNTDTEKIELYEILKQDEDYFDYDDSGANRIVSMIDSPVLFRIADGKTPFDLVRLLAGEVWLDEIRGTTDVQVWYRPDSYPCYTPWTKFSICNPMATDDPNAKPAYRTRIGLGEPSADPCELGNNRQLRTGFWFQFRYIITGPFRLTGTKFKVQTEPQPAFAPVAGCCENEQLIQ